VKFAYELLDAEGRLQRGQLEATNEAEARRQLQRQGATVLGIEEGGARAGAAGRVSAAALQLALTELATLLASGLGVADSVASVAAAHREDPLGPPFERLGREISQGKPFAEALQACGLALPAYFVQLARAGEMTGRLAQSLEEALAQYVYERETAGEMRNALIYPSVLVGTGLVAVGLMFSFVVPRLPDCWRRPRTCRVTLAPGDLQLVNSHVTYHGRTPFEDDASSGRDRLLLRLWLTMADNRPLPADHAVLWRVVAAGMPRGGIAQG